MHQSKNNIQKLAATLTVAVIIVSFSKKQFVFDGGSIINPNIVIAANTTPPEIKATSASGCNGTITYQWQQSPDGKNFMDIPNAINVLYQPILVISRTEFRRRAICAGSDTAYTNVATIIVQPN